MSKKVWRKPEVKVIEAGCAELKSGTSSMDSKGVPNSGS